MTLCAIWLDASGLQMASDSRLSVGDDVVDTSIKVTAFPITLLDPAEQGMTPSVVLRQQIGFCAAGALAPTLAVKESLRMLLARVWRVPGVAEVSMRTFAEMAAAMLKPLWYEAVTALGNDTTACVALAGYCPKESRPRAFFLNTDATQAPARIRITEIALGVTPVFFGSGSAIAGMVHLQRPDLSPLKIIEAISTRGLVESVGGRVQYGKLVGLDFQVYGIYDFSTDHVGRTFTPGYFFGGLEVVDENALPLPDGIQVLPFIVDPFGIERQQLMAAGYNPVTKYPQFAAQFDTARANG